MKITGEIKARQAVHRLDFSAKCNKVVYPKKKKASVAAERMRHKDNFMRGCDVNVYYCERCEGYHIGHRKRRQ
jgi:hypothetical protein